MFHIEIAVKIRNMDEILSKLKNICPNFGKSFFRRNYVDIYFHTMSEMDESLVLRKYEDNTGELILFDETCFDNVIQRSYKSIGLPIPMAEEFINILSQSNGRLRTVSVKSCIYLHFLNTFTVMIDKIEGVGFFAIIQVMLNSEDSKYSEDETEETVTTALEAFQHILEILSLPPDDILKVPFKKLIEEANI